MDKEINLLEIVRILLRRWWIIALAAIFFAVGFFVYSNVFIAKRYASTGTLYVDIATGRPQDLNSIHLSKQLVNSYAEILSSNLYAELVQGELDASGYDVSSSVIKNSLTISPVEDTGIMKLTVHSGDPDRAQTILQAVLDNAAEGVQKVVKTGIVNKIDNASRSGSHISPNVTQNTAVGGLFGAFIAAWVIYLISYFDRKIKHEDDLAKKYNLPVLGIIPDLEEK